MKSDREREREVAETVAAPLAGKGVTGKGLGGRGLAEDATATTTPMPLQTIAGRYDVLGLLGAGGMGTVYKVRDRALDEIVALKTLKREWIDAPGALDRFKREVKLARRVTHKNVARTFDIGETGAEKFLTMEYVDGPSLSRAIEDGGPMPVPEARRIAIAIAEALEAAHAAGVIHRDLKPDNVLLAKDGRVVVTDFGIARGQMAEAGMTAAGHAVGTPAYMSPEQVEAAPIDARSDLYALGLVLFEMLTGRRAWAGDSPFAVAAARLIHPPPDPSAHRSDLPRELVDLVRTLLARRPADRLPDATAAREALAAIHAPAPRGSARRSELPPSIAEVVRSIAVYPLRSAGPPEDAWIAEGLTDDLLDALCMVRGLRVKARCAPAPSEDARAHGARMQVELVVDGTARRVGDGARVQVRLTSVQDGFQVWAQRYDAPIGDLLVVGDRAAQEIARAAGSVSLSSTPAPLRAGVSPEAIELYVRARAEGRSFGENRQHVALLERALALAPDEPRIHAALAIARARETFRPRVDPRAEIAAGRAAAERAIELGPELAEPWVALAHLRFADSDSPGALRALKRALRNGPSVGEVYDLIGRILAESDRLDEAMKFAEQAIWIDPGLAFARIDRLRMRALRRDFDGMIRELEELRSVSPVHYVLASPRMSLWVGRALHDEGAQLDLTGAAASWLRAVGIALATGKLPDGASEEITATIEATAPVSRPRRLFTQLTAELHAFLGERGRALDLLELSVAAGLEDYAWIERCPVLDPIRDDPRFAAAREVVRDRAERVWRAWEEG